MKKGLKIFLIVLVVLVAVRLALEPVVEHYVNKSLDNMEGYSGSIADIDLNLYRGAYRVEGLSLHQTNDSISTPFVTIDTLDLAVDWQALFDGKIAGEVLIVSPTLNFVMEKEGEQEQTGEDTDWVAALEDLMPLTVNRFEITNGTISYKDPSVKPDVDVAVEKLHLLAKNLSNVQDSLQELPASVVATATSIGGGKLDLDMKMNILQQIPEFDAQLKFMSVDLTQVNDFIKAYGNFDVKAGTFSLISEMKVDDGKISGYLKPFFENLDVFSAEQDLVKEKGFFRKAWEALVGAGAEILENQPKDRVATQVPIEGNVSSPDTNVPVAIYNIFRNAFIDTIEKRFSQSAESPE